MSLFGSLYIGDSGLRTAQNGLNTVAHNLSNLNTPGYVRQQVSNSDTTYSNTSRSLAGYNNQVGDGVKYSECRRVRDAFLDAAYRQESGRIAYYETSYSAVLELETILGEFDGAAFSQSISGMWTAMQEIAKSPNDVTNISMLVSRAATFLENAGAVYKSFQEYQGNLNKQVKDSVRDINAIGKRINELNKEIMKIEVGGKENANDLRDERDALLDTLASYGNISYQEDEHGAVSVWFEGVDFVLDGSCHEMKMLTDPATGFVTPYWEHNLLYITDKNGNRVPDYESAYVFDLTQKISTAGNTDVGSLRALLLARGDHVANYTDLTVGACTDRKLEALGISKDGYSENAGLTYYNKYIADSVVMNAEAEFDNLVHSVITMINGVLADNCDPRSGYLCNEDGTPMQMFLKVNSNPYERVALTTAEAQTLQAQGVKLYQIYDEHGEEVPNTYWRYVEEDANTDFSLYNCENTKINQKLVQMPALLEFTHEEYSVDYNLGKKFVEAFQNENMLLSPNATKPSSFENCYIDLVKQVAASGYVFKGLYEFEQLALEQADNERQTVIGVSSDEELEHMIMYQNAYNAASRYINVINSMLDTLLNMGA